METALLTTNERTSLDSNVLLDQLSENIDQALRGEATVDHFLAGRTLAEIERRAIIATIRSHKGNKAASARSLGISEKSIYNKMRRLQISNQDLVADTPESSQAADFQPGFHSTLSE